MSVFYFRVQGLLGSQSAVDLVTVPVSLSSVHFCQSTCVRLLFSVSLSLVALVSLPGSASLFPVGLCPTRSQRSSSKVKLPSETPGCTGSGSDVFASV